MARLYPCHTPARGTGANCRESAESQWSSPTLIWASRIERLADERRQALSRTSFRIDRNLAARVVIDARTYGAQTAADKHGLSKRTVERYCQRVAEDPELTALVGEHEANLAAETRVASARVMRSCFEKLDEFVRASGREDVDKVLKVLESVSGVETNREALIIAASGGLQADPAASKAPRAGDRPADEAEGGTATH